MQTDVAAVVLASLPPKLDGRRARSVRSRLLLVAATRDLMQAGAMRPTVAAIARVAGLSVRAVFQHFKGIDALYREALADAALAQRVVERVLASGDAIGQARAIVCGTPPVGMPTIVQGPEWFLPIDVEVSAWEVMCGGVSDPVPPRVPLVDDRWS